MAEEDKNTSEPEGGAGEPSVAMLQTRLNRVRARLKEVLETAPEPPAKVSPLAPKDGFPELPPVGGVRFAAAAAGVKYRDRDDVMLAEIAPGSAVAGVFTRSGTRAAPVLDCQAKLAKLHKAKKPSDKPFGLVVNSGNANAFTGKAGGKSVEAVCEAASDAIGTSADHIFTSSTGVIGEPLPHDKIVKLLNWMQSELGENAQAAAGAIMTTDTFPKGSQTSVELGGKPVNIVGFAKGSGMIAPDMATMLVYVFTDADVEQKFLQSTLSDLTDTTFNSITVDSDTSTSDSLMLFATGAAGNKQVASNRTNDGKAFVAALETVMKDLAHQVVRDGEGATKFVEIAVTGAKSDAAARTIGKAIANSPLVKTAIAGEDPNWGRIVAAVGKSGEEADRDKLSIHFGDILVAEEGWVADSYHEPDAAKYMKGQELLIAVDVGVGKGAAQVWTCDLTHAYITINADYRS